MAGRNLTGLVTATTMTAKATAQRRHSLLLSPDFFFFEWTLLSPDGSCASVSGRVGVADQSQDCCLVGLARGAFSVIDPGPLEMQARIQSVAQPIFFPSPKKKTNTFSSIAFFGSSGICPGGFFFLRQPPWSCLE